MSGHENPSDKSQLDQTFASILSGGGIIDDVAPGLSVVPMEYERVGVDRDEGEVLHRDFITGQRLAEVAVRDAGMKLENNFHVASMVNNVVSGVLSESKQVDAF